MGNKRSREYHRSRLARDRSVWSIFRDGGVDSCKCLHRASEASDCPDVRCFSDRAANGQHAFSVILPSELGTMEPLHSSSEYRSVR